MSNILQIGIGNKSMSYDDVIPQISAREITANRPFLILVKQGDVLLFIGRFKGQYPNRDPPTTEMPQPTKSMSTPTEATAVVVAGTAAKLHTALFKLMYISIVLFSL